MRRILIFLAVGMLLASTWIALMLGQIAPVQRNIIYAHIPSSICALLCFVVVLVASIAYLRTAKSQWDIVATAAAEVGTILATVLNLTGMIFSRAEWGVWWTPSPRLISAGLLWFLYVVYLILRSSIRGPRYLQARVCAVFGIIAFLDVPMVFISARFIPDVHRANFSFDSGWQKLALFMGIGAMMILSAVFIWLKTDILKNQHKLEKESAI